MPFNIEKYYFNRSQILDGLPPAELQMLEGKLAHREIKKGALLYKEGNQPNGVYFLSKGKVKVFQTNEDGKEQIIYIYTKGESFGYRAILGKERNVVSAQALEDISISVINPIDFIHILHKSSILPNKLLYFLSREFTVWVNLISSFAQKNVRERIALSLLILHEKYKTQGKANETVKIPISRDDLANYVGTKTETLVRMLRHFKDEGIIQANGRQLLVLKPKELEKIVELY
jgi:CRP-like cAMP-binding protein